MGVPRLNEILRLARGFKPREMLPGAVKHQEQTGAEIEQEN